MKLKEALYEHLLHNPFIGICITDGKGICLMVNETQTRISGRSKGTFIGKDMRTLEQTRELSVSSTGEVLKTKAEVNLHQVTAWGRSYDVKGVPVFDQNGEIAYVISYLLDVSEIQNFKDMVAHLHIDKEMVEDQIRMLLAENKIEGEIVFRSNKMKRVVEMAKKVALSHASVLIMGPSGSGKELIADLIHEMSNRYDKPFIKLNCAAMPEHLLESELFGYEAGAFTGGNPKGSKGIFEVVNGGSLLFDEIGEMPIQLQAKLLRVLQDQVVRRIGNNEPIQVDVRIMASTNAPLKKLIAEKRFREDLYYRLNVIQIEVSGLNERKEDIPALIMHFIRKFNVQYGVNKTIHPGAIKRLMSMNYPGNVRELQNIIERLFIQSPNPEIALKDVCEICDDAYPQDIRSVSRDIWAGKSLKEMVGECEKNILKEYLKLYNAETAAKILKIDSSTISRKIQKYEL